MKKIKVINVVGARPNFMKIAPIQRALAREKDFFEYKLVHTGQHYDENMSDVFFRDLEINPPDYFLGVGSGSHGAQTGKIMIEFEKVLLSEKPDLVIVVGDVNSTIACALDAAKLCIPVAHVEAGCRSRDRSMPEEINRILTDAISDFLFTIDEESGKNLEKEGIEKSKIHLVGDTMIDSLTFALEKVKNENRVFDELGVKPGEYGVVTLHRPSNVDNFDDLKRVLSILDEFQSRMPVVFSIHPRTEKNFEKYPELAEKLRKMSNLKLIKPMGYFEFVRLFSSAKVVVTDSGSLQQETAFLNIPCLTLRENTERPVTVTFGSNEIVGLSIELFSKYIDMVMNGRFKKAKGIPLWDGKASERIVKILRKVC